MSRLPPAGPPPEIFDVTIRDGSYVIDFQFGREDVRLLCRALDRSGFRYVEVGHGLGLNASAVKEAAAATDEEYLSAAAEACTRARFGTFFIPGIGTAEHLRLAREHFGMHFVRIGAEPDKYRHMLPFVEYARGLGYEVMCNFMKSYAEPAAGLARKAAELAAAGADVVYVVDSAGGMLPDEVGEYVRAITEQCPARVGFHGHNNLELAVGNSVSAWRNGASLIDCSVGGLGRSSGNTRTELLIPVLKAMGVSLPYDFHEVLRLWQLTVRPLVQRHPVSAREIVGGYARVHSGLMAPFLDAARKHQVAVVSLLDAFGDALHAGRPVGDLDHLAARLRSETRDPDAVSPAVSLLQIRAPAAAHVIQNSFGSFDEVLRAVNVLAHKTCLPVVALVDVAASAGGDPYLVADYLYDDEHFIVLRAAFGSGTDFLEAMRRYGAWIDVLVFDGRSVSARAELAERQAEWHRGQTVLWADLTAAKYHALFAAVYQALAEAAGHNVLFLGGNPQLLARFAPPALDTFDLYCAAPDARALNRIGITRLPRDGQIAPAPPAPSQFDVLVALSPVGDAEWEAVLHRLTPCGLLLDCVSSAQGTGLHGRAAGHAVVTLSLWQALTGELLTLLQTRPGTRTDAEDPLALTGDKEGYERRTRAA